MMDIEISEDEYKFIRARTSETQTLHDRINDGIKARDWNATGEAVADLTLFFFRLGQQYEIQRRD